MEKAGKYAVTAHPASFARMPVTKNMMVLQLIKNIAKANVYKQINCVSINYNETMC